MSFGHQILTGPPTTTQPSIIDQPPYFAANLVHPKIPSYSNIELARKIKDRSKILCKLIRSATSAAEADEADSCMVACKLFLGNSRIHLPKPYCTKKRWNTAGNLLKLALCNARERRLSSLDHNTSYSDTTIDAPSFEPDTSSSPISDFPTQDPIPPTASTFSIPRRPLPRRTSIYFPSPYDNALLPLNTIPEIVHYLSVWLHATLANRLATHTNLNLVFPPPNPTSISPTELTNSLLALPLTVCRCSCREHQALLVLAARLMIVNAEQADSQGARLKRLTRFARGLTRDLEVQREECDRLREVVRWLEEERVGDRRDCCGREKVWWTGSNEVEEVEMDVGRGVGRRMRWKKRVRVGWKTGVAKMRGVWRGWRR